MANLIVSIFVIALMTTAVLVLTSAALSSADRVSFSWDAMAQRSNQIDKTNLTLDSTDMVPTSTNIDVSIRNSGQTALRDYSSWDVIIQYYATSTNQGLSILWLPRATTTPPSSGQWEVNGLYQDADTLESEVYDPNILNPGEEMIVRVNITPTIPTSTDNLITIATPNGVTVAAPFSR